MNIAQRLRKIREDEGLSRPELSKVLGKPLNTIFNYETEARTPSLDYVLKISEHFNIPVSYILGTGVENAPDLTKKELELIEKYRALKKPDREKIDTIIDTFL